jgi:hypothetical protein
MLVRKCGKGTFIHCWWECKLVEALKINLPMTAVLLLGIYLKEYKSVYKKDTCTLMFTTVLFTIAKLWKQPRCPTIDECIKKTWYIYKMEYYSV